MTDRRRYTGTQTLQLLWSVLALVVIVAVQIAIGGEGTIPSPIGLVVSIAVWFVGLLALGFRERRSWQRLVAESAFQPQTGPREADLERIVGGHSVQVATYLPGIFAGTHTAIWASVEGVDASFTITITHREVADADDGLSTGNDTLDERFVIDGRKGNVAKLLSVEVQEALMDVETPGTWTITGDRVEYDVPFTQLTADELDAVATATASMVERLEAIGRER